MRVPHKTNEGRVPQQHHAAVRVSPPEEDERLLSIKPALTNQIVLKTSLTFVIPSDLEYLGRSPLRGTLRQTEEGMLYLTLILSRSSGVACLPLSE